MTASMTPDMTVQDPVRRFAVTPAGEAATVAVAVAMVVVTYLIVDHGGGTYPLSPPLVAFLLVANLLPGIGIMALIGRRIARQRARASGVGEGGRLHTRLVALFAMVAAVPTVLVTIFASLLFQYGVEFWFSGSAKGLLDNSRTLAIDAFNESLRSVDKENVAMAVDIYRMLYENKWTMDDPRFMRTYGQDVFQRSLAQSVIFSVGPRGELHGEAIFDIYDNDLLSQVDRSALARIDRGVASVAKVNAGSTQSLTRIPQTNLYLFSTRVLGTPQMLARMQKVRRILADYQQLQSRSRSLQLRFNGLLLAIAFLVVGVTILIALRVADRLVVPVGELVGAARRIAGGDLTARVPARRERDEVGTLATAFNQMTDQLESQNRDLVTANDQLDNRRALIEAVMAGVSAGVVAAAPDGTIRIANNSATQLLGTGADGLVGQPLVAVAPELADFVAGTQREAIVQVLRGIETRTLAVRIARTEAGPILTFDDITQQVLDQRRAAWSDVARRIAHEIKNPLTPIHLAAERLQRRYGGKVDAGDPTFARLTDTIIRQVGDLRRMVDEFSSFARMPKPVFHAESLVDIARQAMFLHEVAHPGIGFVLTHDDPGPQLVCDRRQLGQAFTNIVKNAVEAIEARGDDGGEGAEKRVTMTLAATDRQVVVEVADTGIGLPADRDRIVEPYMTTRARGTGLGLAIVKKIVEEHLGTIAFFDRDQGGTIVRMTFDAGSLASLDQGDSTSEAAGEGQLAAQFPALSRNRTS